MSKIVEFDETIYSRLCDESLSDIEKWEETVLISPSCGTVESNPKLKVILELVYHTLQFLVSSGLQYTTASVLMDAIQNELICIMQNDCSVITEATCKARYMDIVNKHSVDNSIPVEDIKKISVFYAQKFVRHLASYQYVLQELYTEEQESRFIEIQTPMIPVPLNTCVSE